MEHYYNTRHSGSLTPRRALSLHCTVLLYRTVLYHVYDEDEVLSSAVEDKILIFVLGTKSAAWRFVVTKFWTFLMYSTFMAPTGSPQLLQACSSCISRTPVVGLRIRRTPTCLLCLCVFAVRQGELSKTLELVDENSRRSANPDRVMACEVWGDGVVALLSSGKVTAVSGIHSAEPRQEILFRTYSLSLPSLLLDGNRPLSRCSAENRLRSSFFFMHWT